MPTPTSNFAPYLERNDAFAGTGARLHVPDIPFVPFKQVYLITCIDPRVEPAAIAGVRLGEAIVARNIGGRVTDSVVRDLAWICHLHENKAPDADCGSGLFADPGLRRSYAARGGYDEATAEAMAVLDPHETVRRDVELLRAAPALAGSIDSFKVGGYAYDLKTGRISTVVSPS